MLSYGARRHRRRLKRLTIASVLALLLIAGSAVASLLFDPRPGDVSNPDVEFVEPPAPKPPPPVPPKETEQTNAQWPIYGYDLARTRYFPASERLRPPFRRRWGITGSILLEFSPVIGPRKLYLLKNNGAVYAVSLRTGRVLWKKKIGYLAASSPAYSQGKVYAVLLERTKGAGAGSVVALSARNGKILWRRDLPSRTESSPLVRNDRVYFGSENGTVYALRTSDGAVRWSYKASGAVKGGLAYDNGKLYFGTYGGSVHAIRASDGSKVWSKGAGGGFLGIGGGNFYATAAVAFGRVYIGSTDGRVYSFSARDGKLAWAKQTGAYVYSSAAVAQVPGGKPTVYIGSYDGFFYALDARNGRVRWRYRSGGKISGAPSVVGDVVYFSDLGKKATFGLGANTGREIFRLGRGAFNPVITDGDSIYLTGYSSVYALKPRR